MKFLELCLMAGGLNIKVFVVFYKTNRDTKCCGLFVKFLNEVKIEAREENNLRRMFVR